MSKIQYSQTVFAGILLIVVNSCQQFGQHNKLYPTASDANNSLMSLNNEAETLGEKRIKALAETYPDIEPFIKREGKPRFIAENKADGDHFIVFYYPESRESYRFRNAIGSDTRMEFSGPYPIEDEELAILNSMESGSSRKFLNQE